MTIKRIQSVCFTTESSNKYSLIYIQLQRLAFRGFNKSVTCQTGVSLRSADAEYLPALELTCLLHFIQCLSAQVGRMQPPQNHLLGRPAQMPIRPLVLFALTSKVDFLCARREVLQI